MGWRRGWKVVVLVVEYGVGLMVDERVECRDEGESVVERRGTRYLWGARELFVIRRGCVDRAQDWQSRCLHLPRLPSAPAQSVARA
jgi:hypothetical protein